MTNGASAERRRAAETAVGCRAMQLYPIERRFSSCRRLEPSSGARAVRSYASFGSRAVWDHAPFGISRLLGLRAFRDYAPFGISRPSPSALKRESSVPP